MQVHDTTSWMLLVVAANLVHVYIHIYIYIYCGELYSPIAPMNDVKKTHKEK